ncbi:hypothetical protein ACT29H_14140 [Thermophagus sp. OGC60D27]|uniref:hypothetical protein n=1 Tax=Thermophagus sp. OGC60D27 TaxID=3458415 RepID=UPI004037C00F
MKIKRKKTYNSPDIQQIKLDRVIALQADSDKPFPQPGDDMFKTSSESSSTDGSSSEENTLKQNNFEDNPFQR